MCISSIKAFSLLPLVFLCFIFLFLICPSPTHFSSFPFFFKVICNISTGWKNICCYRKKLESWTKHQMIFVFLNLFVTTPTNYCEIPFLFEKEFALTIIQWGTLLWVKKLLLWVYSQGAQSLLCVLCLEEKSGQKKEHWYSAVCWFWLHFEHFAILI